MKTSNISQGRAHHEAIIRGWVSPWRAGGSGISIDDGSTTTTGITGITVTGGTVTNHGDGTVTITIGGSLWFDVTAYGAAGDGVTDDTAAINLAIAALNTAGAGVLYFPASSTPYLVSAALTTISVPATIMGDGWMTGASGPTSRISFSSTTATLFTVSANGCSFRDLAMLATGTTTAGSAITTTGGVLADFEHVLFDGFWISIDIENSSVWNIRRCYFGTIRKYGIKVRNTASPDVGDWTITECVFNGNVTGDAAIRIESSGGGRIINNKANGNVTGANRFSYVVDMAIGTGASSIILIIEGNSFEGMAADAIRIVTSGTGSYKNVIIVGNQAALYGNNSDRAVNISSTNLTDVLIAHNSWNTNGTARAAVAVTNSTGVRIGPNKLVGFTSEYTNSGGTVVDDTGAIGAAVNITGTPSSGQVPIASSGTAAAWGTPSSGSVATDAIWDAAGDLAVGTGADTAAKLAKGNAGAVLAMGNSAVIWNAGTSFPASKATNDRYFRTDLNAEFYWDGTRWVSTQLFRDSMGVGNVLPPNTIDTAIGRMTPWATDFDLYLVRWSISTYIATTNNGTNYWTVYLYKNDVTDATTVIDSFATSGDTVNNWTQRRRSIGAVYTASSYRLLSTQVAKTLSPGGMYFTNTAVEYRLITT